MQASRSAYYNRLQQPQTTSEKDDIDLTTTIHSLLKKSRGTYGTLRIKKALIDQRRNVSRRQISRLMEKANLVWKTKGKFKATADSMHDIPISPNLLDREFTVSRPDQFYVGDITSCRKKSMSISLDI